jgi:5-methylcytosine-specific restriction endonuclease McrA
MMLCARNSQHRRRVRLKFAGVEYFYVEDIFERDKWICALCGQPVDPSLKNPHPQSKSIDHIIPVSKGGAHTMENVQLAHLVCNIRKGNRDG